MNRDIGIRTAYRAHDGRDWLVTEYLIVPAVAPADEKIPAVGELIAAMQKLHGAKEHVLTEAWIGRGRLAVVNDRHVAVAFDRDDGERCYVNREYLDELLDRTDDAYQPHTWIQYGKVSGLIEARRDGNALGWVMPVSVKP